MEGTKGLLHSGRKAKRARRPPNELPSLSPLVGNGTQPSNEQRRASNKRKDKKATKEVSRLTLRQASRSDASQRRLHHQHRRIQKRRVEPRGPSWGSKEEERALKKRWLWWWRWERRRVLRLRRWKEGELEEEQDPLRPSGDRRRRRLRCKEVIGEEGGQHESSEGG